MTVSMETLCPTNPPSLAGFLAALILSVAMLGIVLSISGGWMLSMMLSVALLPSAVTGTDGARSGMPTWPAIHSVNARIRTATIQGIKSWPPMWTTGWRKKMVAPMNGIISKLCATGAIPGRRRWRMAGGAGRIQDEFFMFVYKDLKNVWDALMISCVSQLFGLSFLGICELRSALILMSDLLIGSGNFSRSPSIFSSSCFMSSTESPSTKGALVYA